MAGPPLLNQLFAFALLLCLLGQINTLPIDSGIPFEPQDAFEGGLFKRQSIAGTVVTTIDQTASQQNALYTSKQAAGYGIVSISVYGDPTNPLYSTVWSTTSQKPFVVVQTNSLYSVEMGGQTQFVVVLEKLAQSPPPQAQIQFNLNNNHDASDTNSLAYFSQSVYNVKSKLKAVTIYGGPSNRLYAAISLPNVMLSQTELFFDTGSAYEPHIVSSETLMPGYKPYSIDFDTDLDYTTVWSNERMPTNGINWQHQYGLTKTALNSAISTAASSGLVPIIIAGGGSTTNNGLVYAVLFGTSDQVAPRTFLTPSGSYNKSYIATWDIVVPQIHNMMQQFMVQYAVRYAQISIKQDGNRRFDFAYAYTEPQNCSPFKCSVSPSDKFMLASNSKVFLSAAIYLMIQKGTLNLDSKVFQLLGYTPTGQWKAYPPIDSRYMDITVRHCLNHTGGWNTSAYTDPTYDMRNIGNHQRTDGQPANTYDIINYMVTNKRLDYTPGTPPPGRIDFGFPYGPGIYSNFGYLVLSALVSLEGTQSYWNFLVNDILQPNGVNMSQISEYQTSPTNRPAGEIVQESVDSGPSALVPTNPYDVPDIYSGDGMIREVDTGAADITCSMDVLSGFLHKNAAWGSGPRATTQRDGSSWGAWTYAQSMEWQNVDWAIAFNTRDWPYPQYTDGSENDIVPEKFIDQLTAVINTTDWINTR